MAGDPLVTPHAVIDWWALPAVEAGWGCLDSHGLGAEGEDNTADRRHGERNRSGAALKYDGTCVIPHILRVHFKLVSVRSYWKSGVLELLAAMWTDFQLV